MDAREEITVEPEHARWCVGLPFTSTRPLTPDERAVLGSLSARALNLWRLVLACMGTIVIAPFALAAIPSGAATTLTTALAIVVAIGWVFGLPILGMLAHDHWRARARLKDDLESGEALMFEGMTGADSEPDDEREELIKAGVLARGECEVRRLAVLTRTHSVLVHDQSGRWRTRPVCIREVAPPPPYAMRVPVSREIASTTIPGAEILKRSLHEGEREELRWYVERLRRIRKSAILIMLYGAFCGVMLVVQLRAGQRVNGSDLFAAVLGVGLGLMTVYRVVESWARAARLSRDLDTGWVFTLHAADETPPANHRLHARMRLRPGHDEEFLPHSMAAWSAAGRPAAWRNLSLPRA